MNIIKNTIALLSMNTFILVTLNAMNLLSYLYNYTICVGTQYSTKNVNIFILNIDNLCSCLLD